jgi:hypothetical protein
LKVKLKTSKTTKLGVFGYKGDDKSAQEAGISEKKKG